MPYEQSYCKEHTARRYRSTYAEQRICVAHEIACRVKCRECKGYNVGDAVAYCLAVYLHGIFGEIVHAVNHVDDVSALLRPEGDGCEYYLN